jgi:hypothetical protein
MSNITFPGMNQNYNPYSNYDLNNLNPNDEDSMMPNYYVDPAISGGIDNNNTFGMADSNSNLGQMFNQYMQALRQNPPAWLKPYIRGGGQEASVGGDPHFDQGNYEHGGKEKFSFQGQAGHTYDLLNDTGLQFNGTFQKYSNSANTIGSTSMTVTNQIDGSKSTISFDKSGVAEVNGHSLKNGQTVNLADGGTATMKDGKLTVVTGEGYSITQDVRNGYIDADVKTGDLGMDNPGGLLAPILTGNTQEENDIKNDPQKYEKEFEVNA